ncbi:MAG: hypothetical protein LQ350_000207 [Teloschistes chrysophthalmus]|nr:MAG: hypothetical protein LQ350_000207 [Niorma chrysophthalma]
MARLKPAFGGVQPRSGAPSSSQSIKGKGYPTEPRIGLGGKSLGNTTYKRHRRIARRGGVKRISSSIYNEIRKVMKAQLQIILQDCVIFLEHAQRKSKL